MLSMYHYTTDRNRENIQRGDDYFVPENGSGRYEFFRGLIPSQRLVPLYQPGLPQEAYEGAIWGFLEPAPDSWVRSNMLNFLLGDIRTNPGKNMVILEVKLLEEDSPYVVDWAIVEHVLRKDSATKEEINAAWRQYFTSRTPLTTYKSSAFVLPEVIVQKRIPIEQLSLIEGISKEAMRERYPWRFQVDLPRLS